MPKTKKSKSTVAAGSNTKEEPGITEIIPTKGKKAEKRKLELIGSGEIIGAGTEAAISNLSLDGPSETAEKPPATKKVRKPRTLKTPNGDQTSEIAPITAVNEVDDSKKKSKRKKRKKKMQEVIPKDQDLMKEKCTAYLEEWKENRSEWKFQKLVQVWLIQNMLDDSRVPDSVFPLFLEYISGAKGNTVKIITEKASKILEEAEKSEADLDDPKLTRARNVIQILVVD